MILQRPGDDLRRTGRVLVHQHDEGHARPPFGEIGVERDRGGAHPTLCAHHGQPRLEKEIGDGNALVEQAPRVIPEIEHQRAGPGGSQSVYLGFHFRRRLPADRLELHVRYLGRDEIRVAHRRHVDLCSGNREPQRAAHPSTGHGDIDRRPRLAP